MDDLLSEFLTETAESLDVIDIGTRPFRERSERQGHAEQHLQAGPHHQGHLRLHRPARVLSRSPTRARRCWASSATARCLSRRPAVSLVLASIDRIKACWRISPTTQVEPVGDDRDLIAQLERGGRRRWAQSLRRHLPRRSRNPSSVPVAAMRLRTSVAEGQGKWDADQGRFLRPGEVSLADLEAAFNER